MTEINEYFQSYSDLEVHKVMLNDIPRNEAYKNAIFNNKEYFNGKTILDVGAGTGILSIFCAQAGASKVYAVDASNITKIAQSVIEENNVQHIVEGRIEDIQLPEKVDIIVSEWMGFYLLHEAMLDSVLFARDKFLKEDGHLFPDKCKIFAAPCTLPSFYSKWDNICDIKMSSFAIHLRKLYNGKPEITEIPTNCLLSEEKCLVELNLKELQIDDLNEFTSKLFTVSKSNNKCQGICIWFSVTFPSLNNENEIVLDTSPTSALTHWKQTVLVMQEEIQLEEGEPFAGTLSLKKNADNSRFYDIEFTILDTEEEDHPVPCECYFAKCKIISALSAQYDEQDGIEYEEVEVL